MTLYRHFSTQDQLDEEYDTERRVTTPEGLIALRAGRAEVNRTMLARSERMANQHYGPTLAERVDVYRAEKQGSPVLLYMHGGYWSGQGDIGLDRECALSTWHRHGRDGLRALPFGDDRRDRPPMPGRGGVDLP